MNDRITVIYVASSGRSGSTILDNVLGEIPGHFSVGEIRFIWDRNVQEDRICGCGRPFSSCPVWQHVMDVAFGGHPPKASEVVAWRESAMRLRKAPFVRLPGVRRRLAEAYAPLLDVLERLYHAVAEVTGAAVIVDSSKYPSYGYLLSLIDSLDVRFVYLVRDPRAVAYSWTRTKVEVTTEGVMAPMGRHAPWRSALDWNVWALLAEHYRHAAALPSMRLRYEDFVRSPAKSVDSILEFAGRAPAPPGFLADGAADLSGNHTVGGNPGRLRTGRVALRADNEWRSAMKPVDRWAVTGITLPGALAYGYIRGRS